jgi:hypothetical protein
MNTKTVTPNNGREGRAAMVGWYDPLQLIRTASAVAVSSIFGRNADYRLLEAVTAPEWEIYDHSADAHGDFWIDYVADTGDGWNSTYAVAYSVALEQLALKDPTVEQSHVTRRGSILVFGGDEVYPVASRSAYRTRLRAPYETALLQSDPPHPEAFAVAGNHDWYDSLVSFTRLFCSGRWFGGWCTKQTRSYFAIKLPRGWWLLGTDIQLYSDVDDQQVKYFKDVAAKMQPDDRVILCNAEPHWIYAHIYGKNDSDYSESNLAFIEKIILKNKIIELFLAGDLHHYRRHEDVHGAQKITAGGGGAFLHPTHGPDVSQLQGGYVLKKSFPDQRTSRALCWRNFLFLFLNPWFGTVTGIFYMLTAWASKTDLSGFGIGQFRDALAHAVNAGLRTPVAAFWVVALFLGFWLFTDTHSKWYRFVGGTSHAVAHLFAAFLIGWGATYATVRCGYPFDSSGQLVLAGVVIVLAGWVIGSVIMGIYLLVSLNVFRRHSNEAFSSLAIEDWKNFLRMKIDVAGNLTIYPVGIKRVPRRWTPRPAGDRGPELVPNDPRATPPELIEQPITIKPRRPG